MSKEIDHEIIEIQEYHLYAVSNGIPVFHKPCFEPYCDEPHYMVSRVGEAFGDVPATIGA